MKYLIYLLMGVLSSVSQAQFGVQPYFSSENAEEVQAEFQAVFQTEWRSLRDIQNLSEAAREEYTNQYILTTLKYLYGPLNSRLYGNPQRDFKVVVDWSKAQLNGGLVFLPYLYQAKWILHRDLLRTSKVQIPVPLTAGVLETPRWTACTDPQEGHQNMGMFWYYWDPSRPGCDHKIGLQYQEVVVSLKNPTPNLKQTYPEYAELFRKRNGQTHLNLTFGFGYVETPADPYPEKDNDYGMLQFRDFVNYVRKNSQGNLSESPIFQNEFLNGSRGKKIMGYRFQGFKNGVKIKIDILAAGDVDQMDIFSKSFAQDHDSFFGWFGHSRLGWGFDSDILLQKLNYQNYSISNQYQIVYWAGCNSYSYYTLPFFQLKVSPQDPFGTKKLDIISNGLSSYFALNSANAKIILKHLMNWDNGTSYQVIVRELENAAARVGAHRILINVLGDEDNPQSRP